MTRTKIGVAEKLQKTDLDIPPPQSPAPPYYPSEPVLVAPQPEVVSTVKARDVFFSDPISLVSRLFQTDQISSTIWSVWKNHLIASQCFRLISRHPPSGMC